MCKTPERTIRQQLFNASLEHVRKQGKASMLGTTCVYRGPNGEGCAAAPFIRIYSPDMENTNWHTLASRFPQSVSEDSRNFARFVTELQRAHDSSATYFVDDQQVVASDAKFMERYESAMKRIAENHRLDYVRQRKEPVFAGCGSDISLPSL